MPIFLYFYLFNRVDSKQMFNANIVDAWIWTAEPLVFKATALTTEPQPLPEMDKFVHNYFVESLKQ